jgi:hypothetical protein
MNMPDSVALIVLSAIINAATTWGVVSTKLAWLRRDVDDAHRRIDSLSFQPRQTTANKEPS